MSSDDAQARSERGGGLPWYAWEIFLFVAFVPLCAALFGVPAWLDYSEGRRSGEPSFGGALGAFAGLSLLVLGWLAVWWVRMLAIWPRHIHGWRRLVPAWAGSLAGAAACLVAWALLLGPGYRPFTWGFRDYARANVDVASIQGWLVSVDPNACTGRWLSEDEWQAAREDWPATITRLCPRYIALDRDAEGRPMIRAGRVAFDAMWGVAVGHPEMVVPATQQREKEVLASGHVLYRSGEYRLPLAPGAYVWHNIE